MDKNYTQEYIESLSNELRKRVEEIITNSSDEAILQLTKKFKEETDKQLGILAGAGSAFKPKQVANIEILKNVNAKVDEVYEVLGYYRFDDGANHKRKISNKDDGSGVQLANKLWANILFDGNIYVEYLGAKGDGTTDDTQAIQKAIDNYEVVSFKNKTYVINGSIKIKSSDKWKTIDIYFNNTTIALKGELRNYAISIEMSARIYGKLWLNCWSLAKVGLLHTSSGGNNRNYLDCIRVTNAKLWGIALRSSGMFDTRSGNINFSIYNQLIVAGCGEQLNIPQEGVLKDRNKFVVNNYSGGDIESLKEAISLGSVCGTFYIDGIRNIIKIYSLNIVQGNLEITLPPNYFHPVTIDKIKFTECFICSGGGILINGNDANCLVINNIDLSKNKIGLLSNSAYGNTISSFSSQADAISALIGPGGNSRQLGNSILNVYLENFGLAGIVMMSNNENVCKIYQYNQDHTEIIKYDGNNLLPNGLGYWNFFPTDSGSYIFTDSSYNSSLKDRLIFSNKNRVSPMTINLTSDRKDFTILEKTTAKNKIFKLVNRDKNYKFRENNLDELQIDITAEIGIIKFHILKDKADKKIDIVIVNGVKTSEVALSSKMSTSYMATKMQQEGVYNDYISYIDEKTLYNDQQLKQENQMQLAYEQALQENPELTYNEFLSMQPMTLNLIAIEEPQPSEALKKFMEKYL